MNTNLPPPDLLYQVSRDSDQSNFLRSSDGQVSALLQHLAGTECDFDGDMKFLDFGCGVGKVLIGLRNLPKIQLYGCDLDKHLIDWCQNNLNAKCYANDLLPPLDYSGNYFDLVNAISVFTHLNLEMQFRWAWELYRVIKPDGYLHFTVHGPAYFGLYAHVAKTRPISDLKIHTFEDAEMLMELEQPIQSDLYVSKTGTQAQGQLEVAVAHTEPMIRKIFSPFALEKKIVQGGIGGGHDVYVLKKNSVNSKALFDNFETIEDLTKDTKPIAFDLNINQFSGGDCKSKFRIFATAMPMGVLVTEVNALIKIRNGDNVLSEVKVSLTKGCRFFGDCYWVTVDIDLPLGYRNLSIEIKSKPTMDSYLQGIKWLAPQVIDLNI